MTDKNPTPPAMPIPDCSDFLLRYQAFEARAAELHPANKTALFAVLRDAGITGIHVHFDGYGDSGQIEGVTAFGADGTECPLPDRPVSIRKIYFGQDEPEVLSEPLAEAIETLAYAFLESTHGGWENNEGAYGEFLFDVAAGTITLDYKERIESVEDYSHEF